jgi:imidazole glycerol phosphate synthase glutamine amidotransferase subunit
MKSVRVIPRLDIKGPNLVKGIHLEGLRVLGVPERFAETYFHDGADELLFVDIVASLYGRNNLEGIVQSTVRNVFIPITVGGGIRSLIDIQRLLRAGADKVAINTAAVNRPELITEAARSFGSQCVVVSIEAIAKAPGRYEAYTDNGREPTLRDVVVWAREAQERGAGELLLTSVDREGTGQGYDVALISSVLDAVQIPVIACGGAGNPQHVIDMVAATGVDAVSAASVFHYDALRSGSVEKRGEGNVDYLRRFVDTGGTILKQVTPVSVSDLKASLRAAGVETGRTGTAQVRERSLGGTSRDASIVIVDYGCSNLFNVERAFANIGVTVRISSDPGEVAAAGGLVLAGVGAFGEAMAGLQRAGLVSAIKRHVDSGKPLLGICLGMQLFMERSEEFGFHEGLGLFEGSVTRLDGKAKLVENCKVPHIGWNTIEPTGQEGMALEGVSPGSRAYYVHSYVVEPADSTIVTAETSHGGVRFCAVVERDQLLGCQFHPERSGEVGLTFLRNFASKVAPVSETQAVS